MTGVLKCFSLLLLAPIAFEQLSQLLAQSVGDQCDFEILPPDLPITVAKLGANWTVTKVYFALDVSFALDLEIEFDMPTERNFWAAGDIFELGCSFNSITRNDKVVVQPDGGFSTSTEMRDCFNKIDSKNAIRFFTSSSFSFKYTPNFKTCKPRTVQGFYVAGPCDISIALDQNSESNIISFPLIYADKFSIVYPCNTTCTFTFDLVDSSPNFIGITLRVSNMVNGSDIVSITNLDTGKAIEFSGNFNSSGHIDLGTFGAKVEFQFRNLEYRQSSVQISYNVRPTASDGDCDSISNDEFYCHSYAVLKKQFATKVTVQMANYPYRSTTNRNSLSGALFDEKNFTCTEGSCLNGGSVSSRSNNDSTCICVTGFTEICTSANYSIGFTNIHSETCAITDSFTSESNAMVIQSGGTVENVSVSFMLPNGLLSIDKYIAIQSVYCVEETMVPVAIESSIGPLPPCTVSTVYEFELAGYSSFVSNPENYFVQRVNFTCTSPPETTETSTFPTSTTTTSEVPTTTLVTHDNTDLGKLKANITIDNVEEVLSTVATVLAQLNGSLSELNVTDCTEALLAAASIPGISAQAGVPFDQSIDLLLEMGSDKFSGISTDNLLIAIKLYDKNVNLTIGQSTNNSGNLFVHVVNFVDCQKPHFQVGIVDVDSGQNATASSILNTGWDSHQNGSHSDTLAMITITPTVVCADTSSATRLSFQLFRTSTSAFVPNSTNEVIDDTYCRMCQFPGSLVISGTVVDRNGDDVDIPMSAQIEFRKHLHGAQGKFDRNFQQSCGYWQSSGWITDDNNISLVSVSGDNYKFNSTHLTDFSLIGSNNPKDKIFCQSGLSVLGTLGCVLSFLSLFFLTLFLLAIRTYVDSNAVAYFSHLFIGVLAIFFLFFALFSDQTAVAIDDSVCSAFAAVNYFLLLSTMFLTCGQAVLVFQEFFNVVKKNFNEKENENSERITEESTFKLYAVVSIVAPALIVICCSLSKSFLVRSDFFCWINPDYANLAVVIPIAIMLVFTIGLTSFGLFLQYRSNGGKLIVPHQAVQRAMANLKKGIKKVFGLQVILGLPWIFLFLTEIPDSTAFHYIFTITNAFQGVWISAAYLLIEHRKEMRKLIQLIRDKFPSKPKPHRVSNLVSDESEMQATSDIIVGKRDSKVSWWRCNWRT